MLEEINKYDLIITTRAIKKEILSKATKEKKLIKSKVLSKEEFIKEVTPQISDKALYFLMKKYKLNYFSAKQYLKNNLSADSFAIINTNDENFTTIYRFKIFDLFSSILN